VLEFSNRSGWRRSLCPKSSLLGGEHVFLANLGAIRCARHGRVPAEALGEHQRLAAKLNVHVPYAYPKDVLSWFPTQRAGQVGELMPYR
jgi:hypothetical protein